jgi:hypothetical protein
MSEDKYKCLRHLLGSYLHQDWKLEFPTPCDAIAAFREKEPTECVQGACKELEEVIPFVERMQDADTFLWQDLWCYYSPKTDGLSVADWFRQVRDKLCA